MKHKSIILLCVIAFMVVSCSQSPQTGNPAVPIKKTYKIVVSDRSNDAECDNCWIINIPVANILDEWEIVDQALLGEVCRSQGISEDERWIYCEFNDYKGWVASEALIEGNYDLGYEQVLVVTDPIGYLINYDGSEIPVAMNTVLYTFLRDDYAPILPTNILRGMRGAEIREATNPFPQKERLTLCEKSYEFIGQPYTWGGITAAIEGSEYFLGPDCSGFVQSLFRFAGLEIPRNANQQYHAGCPIKWEEIQPGDAVFQINENGFAFHVGIASTYIAEDGTLKIIESDYPGGVSMKHTLKMWKNFEATGHLYVEARSFYNCDNIRPYKPM